jgi:hypothetical protein
VAHKTKDRKLALIEGDLGRAKLQKMSEAEAKKALWDVAREICNDPDGLDDRCVPLVNISLLS